jgi:hypothetical protein
MATGITDAFVQEFERNVYHLGQQKESRLMTAGITVKYDNAEKFSFDRVSAAAMSSKSGTGAVATPVSGLAHSRRVATAASFAWGEIYNANDVARMLIDPGSEAVKAASAAVGRQIDTVITTAADGSAATGQHGAGAAATFLAGNRVLTGAGQAMNLNALRTAKRLLDAAEVDSERYIAINAKALSDLLKVTEVASTDYNSVKALVNGEVDTYMGFKFIRTERLPAGGGAGRTICLGWAKGAIGLGLPQYRFTRVQEDPANSFATRIYMELTLGAVRIEEEAVVSFEIDNAA